MPIFSGDRLGPYEIIAAIGKGGMGEVWRARDPRLGRDVAIKTSAAQFSARFQREARAIAALNHPNICQIYDIGADYLVMELIEGTSPRGPLAAADAVRLALGIAAALEAAHGKGITHRDLKPANVLVTSSGVKLLDFGLALFNDDRGAVVPDDQTALTMPGAVLGTIAYMSPEQAQGKPADARTDIFAFGLLLYELLTGRRAFTGDSPADTMAAIIRDEPAPLQLPSGDAPAALAEIVARCLRKAPDARFQTMSDVRVALETMTATRIEPSPAIADTPSIAVLPFANMSGDKENEYFSDGLAEEILNLLARIPGLRVIARTSSFAFRGKEQDITTIASALRVRTVLEGSVRRSGNRVRITAQLIEAENGSQLWSERYDRDLTDVFAIQDEIGQAISQSLQVRLAPRTRVKNLDAWEHWLKGVHHRGRNTPDGVVKAKEHFEQASILDPTYAQAYSGLAFCYFIMAAQGSGPLGDMTRLAVQAAEKALVLDPSDSDAHAILGVIAGLYHYQWHLAEAHYLRALACESVSARARYCYAMYCLLPAGRTREAIEQTRLALQSDPLFILYQQGVGFCLYFAGQYREALEQAGRAMDIDPTAHLALQILGFAQLGAGVPADAVRSFRRLAEIAPWTRLGAGCMAAAYCAAGDEAAGREAARLFTDNDRLGFGGAIYYATAGEPDGMFEALDACYQRREIHLPNIARFSMFDPYRDDPRFRDLLARMNL